MHDLRRELALGYRVLGSQGIGLGLLAHITVREPGATTFWTYQLGQSVEEVRVCDLREVDFELNIQSGGGEVNPNLRIHSEIYAQRPDVLSIVHHHGSNCVALSSIGHCLEPFDRDAGRWSGEIALVESYESPVLRNQGASIATALGSLKALLLKHHGVLVVGESVADSVVSAIEIEKSCGVQLKAMSAGKLHMLPDAEIEDTRKALGSRRYHQGMWNYYVRSLRRNGLDADIDETGPSAFAPIATPD
jgi:L-fuculose-phosphate aldolase